MKFFVAGELLDDIVHALFSRFWFFAASISLSPGVSILPDAMSRYMLGVPFGPTASCGK